MRKIIKNTIIAFQALLLLSAFNARLMAQSINVDNIKINVGTGYYISTAGSMQLQNSGAIDNSGTLKIGSNWTNNANGLINASAGTVELNGATQQTIGGSAVTIFNNLIINNSNGITLAGNIIVNGTLTFTNGKITTGANYVILGNSATVTGAGAGMYVNGNLRRFIPATANAVVNFQIGDATNYTPVQLTFVGTPSGASSIDAATNVAAPPLASGISQTQYVNRQWNLTNNGVTGFTSYSAIFNFAALDIIGGANTANFIVAKLNAPNWSLPTVGAKTSTSTEATGATSFGTFALGVANIITWYLDADNDGYYVSTTQSVYSPGAGYTSTLPANGLGDCNDNDVNVYALPIASTITAGGTTTFCAGGSVTLSGNNGGTWSSGGTQASISVTSSGTYSVTTTNSCGNTTSNSIAVTVNPLPTAPTITAGGPTTFCNGGNVVLTGQSSNVSTLAGGTQGNLDGPVASARFNSPYAIATDAAGNVYVADYGNNQLRKISASGSVTTIVVAGLTTPQGVATDAAGNVFVSGRNNHKIFKITSSGTVTTFAGTGIAGFADGNSSTAQFNQPYGLATDASGNVYVADRSNHRIRKIDPSGNVTTLAGGIQGYADGSTATAQFNQPDGVACDAAGNVYVGDANNSRVRKIDPSGNVTTFSGTYSITQIATDADGNVYVASRFNHSIRKITPSGTLATLAGTGVSGFADGNSAVAQFAGPTGIATDAAGNVYVADFGNHRIRKITNNSYLWSNGATTPSITASTAGDYTVTVTNASGCSATSAVTAITVNALPDAGNITGVNSLCIGSSSTFISSVNGGTWSIANNEIATINQQGVVNGVTLGSTTLNYTFVSSNGCSSVASKSIEIKGLQNLTELLGSNSVCIGSTINLTSLDKGGSWKSSDNTKASISNGIVKGIAVGTTKITYSLGSGNCYSETSKLITVEAAPIAAISGPSKICWNGRAMFKASVAGGVWGVENSALLLASPQGLFRNSIKPTTDNFKSGVNYTLKSKLGACTSKTVKSVWVRNITAPSITISALKTGIKVNEITTATATTTIKTVGTWTTTSTVISATVEAANNKKAAIKGLRTGTGANIVFFAEDGTTGCRQAGYLAFNVTSVVSMVDANPTQSTSLESTYIYPNPSNGKFTIANINGITSVKLFDLSGRLIATQQIAKDNTSIDFSEIATGKYMVHISGEAIDEVQPIVIE